MRDSRSKSKYKTSDYVPEPQQQQHDSKISPWSHHYHYQGSNQASNQEVPLPSSSFSTINPNLQPFLPRGNGGFGEGFNKTRRPQTKTEYFEVEKNRYAPAQSNFQHAIKTEPWDVNLSNNNPVKGKNNLGLKHSYDLRNDAKRNVKAEQNYPPSFKPINNEGSNGYGEPFNDGKNDAFQSGHGFIPTLVSDPKLRKKASPKNTRNTMERAATISNKPKTYRRSRSRSKTKKYRKRSRSPSPPPRRYKYQSSTQYRNPSRSKSPVAKRSRRSASKSKSPSSRRSTSRSLYGRSKSVFNEAHRLRLKKEKDYEIDRLLHVKKREEKLKDEEREFADRLLSLKVIEEEEKVNELKEERLERERKLHNRQKKLREMKEEYDNLMSIQIQRSKSTRPVSPKRAKSRAATVTKSRRRSKSKSRYRSRQNSRSHDRANTTREKSSFVSEKLSLNGFHGGEIGSKRRSRSRECRRSSSRSSDGARSVFDGSRLGRRTPARMRLGSRKPK